MRCSAHYHFLGSVKGLLKEAASGPLNSGINIPSGYSFNKPLFYKNLIHEAFRKGTIRKSERKERSTKSDNNQNTEDDYWGGVVHGLKL